MHQDPKTQEMSASFEEMACSNMLVVQALVELLTEKGLLDRGEILKRIERLKQETKINRASAASQQGGKAMARDTQPAAVLVSVKDLVSANMIGVEALMALLFDKGFLTQSELDELLCGLRKKAQAILRKQ